MCGKKFARGYNLNRHIENVHAEEQSTDSEMEDDGPDVKKLKDANLSEEGSETENDYVESEDDEDPADEDESSSDLEDNTTYQTWLSEAKDSTRDMREEKYDKYIKGGMSEPLAIEKANIKTLWAVKRNFFDTYKEFLISYQHLKDNDTHLKIVSGLEEKIEKNVKVNKALNRVIAKYQPAFDGLFQQDDDDEADDDDNEEDANNN